MKSKTLIILLLGALVLCAANTSKAQDSVYYESQFGTLHASPQPDTLHAIFQVSRAPGQPYIQVRGAWIKAVPHYQTNALLNKGKWFPFRKGWHIGKWEPCEVDKKSHK